MPDISLTDFVDYVLAPGPSQLAKVKEVKRRPDYEPQYDYWRELRGWLIELETGELSLREVQDRIDESRDGKRVNYQDAFNGFKKFRKKSPGPITTTPKRDRWQHDGLTVRVNPELCYKRGTGRIAVKCYFKKDPAPTKHRADIILLLVKETIVTCSPALLDVRNGKLIESTLKKPDLDIYLRAQATAFVQMWKQLG